MRVLKEIFVYTCNKCGVYIELKYDLIPEGWAYVEITYVPDIMSENVHFKHHYCANCIREDLPGLAKQYNLA